MRRQTEYVHPRQHAIQGTMRRQTEYDPSQHTIQGTNEKIHPRYIREKTTYIHPSQHTIQGTMRRQTEYVHPRQHTMRRQGTMREDKQITYIRDNMQYKVNEKTNGIRTSESTYNTGTMRRQTEYVHPRQHAIQGTMRRQRIRTSKKHTIHTM